MKELDVNSLKKGDYLPPDELAKYAKYTPDSKNWQFDLMRIRAEIESKTKFSVKSERDGLRILDDNECSEYNNNSCFNHLNGYKYRHKKMLQADTKKMFASNKENHMRFIEIHGKIVQGIDEEIKRSMPLDITNYQSIIPKLFTQDKPEG